MTDGRAVAIDLDGALADTRPLWDDWLESASSVLGVDAEPLAESRADAAARLDRHGGNWRVLLERFCEERVAVYVRRDPATSETLRALSAADREIGVFTDAPEPLARLVLAQIGADRRVSVLEAGAGALARLLATLGPDVVVVATRADLLALTPKPGREEAT
ncbi:MAG: hypothetical protein R6W48_04360 [Gaiellaceae bacterium]